MQANIFLILSVIFVTTSTGHGYVRHPIPHQDFHPLEIAAVNPSFSSTNGSTHDEIMQELGTRTEIQQSGCHFSKGAYGGGGGGSFNDLPNNCAAIVKSIKLRSGSRIDAIQITFRYSDGSDHTTARHGGSGGGEHNININIDSGERIVAVTGRSGSRVDQLQFITNFGRLFGPYGGGGGGGFSVASCLLRGIFGRSGGSLDSIGFYCSQVPLC